MTSTNRTVEKLDKWLTEIRGRGSLAIILGGTTNGLSFVRSLGRRRIPTLLLETDRFLGTYTRYGKVALLPPVESFAQDWITLLESLGLRLDRPGILFPTSDEHCMFVAEHSEILQHSYRFLVPDIRTLARIVNKRSQYSTAQAAEIPIPRVHFPESVEEVSNLAGDLPYPCLLKPYESHTARKKLRKKVAVVRSRSELMSAYEGITAADIRVMIQEIVPGDDSALWGYLAFWNADGRELAWLTKRKLRQYPPQFGDGSLQITANAPEVAELSRRLLRAFDYRGFVGVEFKLSARDQTYRLMEINPRTVSGNQLAIAAGIDFPWIGYQYLTGIDHGDLPVKRFRSQVKYLHEEWDIQAYLALRKSGEMSFGKWVRSILRVNARAIGAWDDPAPLLVGIWRFLRHLCGKGAMTQGCVRSGYTGS